MEIFTVKERYKAVKDVFPKREGRWMVQVPNDEMDEPPISNLNQTIKRKPLAPPVVCMGVNSKFSVSANI